MKLSVAHFLFVHVLTFCFKIEVSSKDVDTILSKQSERASVVYTERRDGAAVLEQGACVVIQKGKHEGKEGTISCLKRHVVIVTEDFSGEQVFSQFIWSLFC